MQERDIDSALADLGQELRALGVQQPIRVLMVGGAFMLTQVHNRALTDDVDVVLKDADAATASPLNQAFRAAVRAVATRQQLPSTWLNDVIGDALRSTTLVPGGTLWRRYGMLEVYIPPDDYILALKLFAGRDKDRDDILALCQRLGITTRQQAQDVVNRYVPDRQLQQLNGVADTLADLFP